MSDKERREKKVVSGTYKSEAEIPEGQRVAEEVRKIYKKRREDSPPEDCCRF